MLIFWYYTPPNLCDVIGLVAPLLLRRQSRRFRGGLVTLAVGRGVTGNTGMEWQLILASSRWRRWVRWSAPAGRRPTPGCRSSRKRSPPAPSPDSSPYRWWLRSSRTNLQGGREPRLVNYQIIFLCSVVLCLVSRDEPCLPSGGKQVSVSQKASLHITSQCFLLIELHLQLQLQPLQSFPCSAHLHGLTWHDLFVRPPHRQPSWHFNLCSWQPARCQCVWLSGHLGARQMRWRGMESKPGMLERAAKSEAQWTGSGAALTKRAWSTIDKWSIKPLVTGSDS